ncbi:MAG: nucleotide-binding protein [Chitinophagaceae bacterium]
MATRKKTELLQRQPDALIVDRASFIEKLQERLKIAKSFLDKHITQLPELEELEKEYFRWDNYNSEYLKQSFNNEDNTYKASYDRVNEWIGFGTNKYDNTGQGRFQKLRDKISNKIENIERLIEKAELLKSDIGEAPLKPAKQIDFKDNNNVFIVHGHNIEIQQSVARVIEKLGLNVIILQEQPNEGKTVIEKFESNSNVGFAIILLTDDDEGKAKTQIDLQKRARQNVILELGYFIGKLGRGRVLPLYSEGVELPSDIHGVLYVPIDKAANWKFSISSKRT